MPGLYAFPRRERLIRKRDFLAVYARGEKRVGPHFVCYVARQEGQGRKLGLAVSRKVGGAVVRNRVKRLVREVYRTHRQVLPADAYIVVVARPAAAALDFHACQKALDRLLRGFGATHG